MAKRKDRSFTLSQPVVEAAAYESPKENEPLADDLVEEFLEQEPAFDVPVKRVEPKEVRIAYTANIADNFATARAKVTSKKFVGKWIELKAGKTITDDKDVIAHLRAHGLVE
jgi:hypothetical protein